MQRARPRENPPKYKRRRKRIPASHERMLSGDRHISSQVADPCLPLTHAFR